MTAENNPIRMTKLTTEYERLERRETQLEKSLNEVRASRRSIYEKMVRLRLAQSIGQRVRLSGVMAILRVPRLRGLSGVLVEVKRKWCVVDYGQTLGRWDLPINEIQLLKSDKTD